MATTSASLRLAFMGTPDFAVPALTAVAEAGHEIACVYSQPPRPAGRGQKPRSSPVQALAEARGWPVRTPLSLKDRAEQAAFADLGLDVAVVVAYGLLLPRWRGAAPIQRAILAGDRETGITIMQMDEGLDTGPMLLQEHLPIGARTTAAELHDALAALGADLIVRALDRLARDDLSPQAQPEAGVTYAAKLERAEGRLDWRLSAEELARRVRAFAPWPGAFTELPGATQPERLKVLAAEALIVEGQADAAPGTLLLDGLTVACGEGALRLLKVQRAGKAVMTAGEFLRGRPLAPGIRLPVGHP